MPCFVFWPQTHIVSCHSPRKERCGLCLGSSVSHRQSWLKLTVPCHILSVRHDSVLSAMECVSVAACCSSAQPRGTILNLPFKTSNEISNPRISAVIQSMSNMQLWQQSIITNKDDITFLHKVIFNLLLKYGNYLQGLQLVDCVPPCHNHTPSWSVSALYACAGPDRSAV